MGHLQRWKRIFSDDFWATFKVQIDTREEPIQQMNNMPVSFAVSVDRSSSTGKQYPLNGDASENVFDLDIIELNVLRQVSEYSFQHFHDGPKNKKSYEPIRTMRILPAPPPSRFTQSRK
jgi:hypothetical protein